MMINKDDRGNGITTVNGVSSQISQCWAGLPLACAALAGREKKIFLSIK